MSTERFFPSDAYHEFMLDFDEYDPDDWAITTTEAGAGSATEAITPGVGGLFLITNAAGDNDSDELQWAGRSGAAIECWKFVSGKALSFKTRFKVSDATQSDLILGLCITDTTLVDGMTDGIYFRKDDGDAYLDMVIEQDSTETVEAAVATLADDTFVIAEFYYDGSVMRVYIDESPVASVALTNVPDDEELTVSIVLQNGEAVAKTATIDYVKVVQER